MIEQSQHNATDALIVGAGPTGLMMACQLAMHQIPFRIIDKKATSSQNSGALIVQARTLEILEQMGLASDAIKQGVIADRIDILYNGKITATTSIKDIGLNLSQFPFLLLLEQSKTEKLLLKYLHDHDGYVERNVQFKSFTESNSNILTEVVMPYGSGQTILSKYLIGADGSKSAIRDFLNIPFQGKTYTKPIFILDSKAKSDFSPGVITFAFTQKSVAGFFPLANQRWRVDGSFPGKVKTSETITLETVTNGLQQWNNVGFKLHDTEWFSVSHAQQKYAQTIRIGNCFLAGDAAHVNTPVGAQGMNTGLQDAHNLAWKLAFVLKKKAKPELLNSYSTERLGISKGFARYADVVFTLATNTNIVLKFFRTIALKIFFKRIFPKLEHQEKWRLKFFKSISQIDIRYKTPFVTHKHLENQFINKTPKPGARIPYINFMYDNKNTNSHKILNATSYTLLVLAHEITAEIHSIVEKYSLEVIHVKRTPETVSIYSRLGIPQGGYYLIRPDMYIVLRSPTLETDILNNFLQLSGKK